MFHCHSSMWGRWIIYLCLEPCSWLWRCPLVREPDLLRCLLLLSLERERERRLSRDVERERLLRRSRERDLRERGCQLLVQCLIMTNSRRMRLLPFMFPAAWSGSMWKRSRRIDILQYIYTLKHAYTLKHLTSVLTSSSFFPPSPFLLFFLSAPGFFSPACRQQLSAQNKKRLYDVYNSCKFLSLLPQWSEKLRHTFNWSSFSLIWMKPRWSFPPKWSARRRSLSWRPR